MTYVAVMDVVEGRVAKYAEFTARKDALSHVESFARRWPEAFVSEKPAAPDDEWWAEDGKLSVVPSSGLVEDYQHAINAHLDATAKARQYDGAISLVGYMGSTNPQWAAEAAAFTAWRDDVWAYAYQQLALVQSGKRRAPSVSEFVAELPLIGWPS